MLFVAGCHPATQSNRKPKTTTSEVTGTKEERIAAVSRIVLWAGDTQLQIDDARLIEVKIGDGQLGPSDYQSFLWIKLSPDQVTAWTAELTPLSKVPHYSVPPTKTDWWLTKEVFDEAVKYEARNRFGRSGWTVITKDGNVFAMTFTT